MNFKILLISVIFLKLLASDINAQSPEKNFDKYQIYRHRLYDEFMVSSNDNEQGTNIPASLRNKYTRQMRWGDATINLSLYMSVLATEYKLLKINNLPVEESLLGLHNAISAIERLDVSAELVFGNKNALPIPNGFFIRDDVPSSFTSDWAWKNPSFADYPRVSSDYMELDTRVNEMSQDQVWHLIIGLALISHLVDDTTRWKNPQLIGYPLFTLSQRAMIVSFQIIKALQYKNCLRFFGGQFPCLLIWNLRNPVTDKAVKRGSNPGFLKYGFAESGNYIFSENFENMHRGLSPYGKVWFNLLKSFQYLQRFTPVGNIIDIYHAGSLATVGNIWSTRDLIRIFNRHQKLFFVPNPQYEHFALISCIFHNDCPKILQREKKYYENLLNTAPAEGPSNYGNSPNHVSEYNWSSINRFVWPERRGDGISKILQGEYNGLDFMLLYNLYHLVYNPLYLSNQ